MHCDMQLRRASAWKQEVVSSGSYSLFAGSGLTSHLTGGAGVGPLPADRRHPGRRDGPGHPKCEADRQRTVLLQGGY